MTSGFYTPVWRYKGYQLAQRPDTPNYYMLWYLNGKFKKRSTRTSDLELAQQTLIDHAGNVQFQTDAGRVPAPHEVWLDDVLAYYLEKKVKGRSLVTAQQNLLAIRAFMREHGIQRVHELLPDTLDLYPEFRDVLYAKNQLRRYMSYRKYAGWSCEDLEPKIKTISDATIGRELSVLNAALRFYRKRQRITQVPFIQLPPPPPARSRWLTPAEYGRLYACADSEHLRDFMELLIRTLQRPGFVLDLQLDQIDLARRRISFLKRGMRQTNKRRPDVRISEHLVPLIKRRMRASESGYLLEYDGHPIRDLQTAFRIAASAAGLHDVTDPSSERVIPYTLRHTGATWLAQAGVDLWQIAGMLGHKDTRMVERVYAKHHPDFQKKAVGVLDEMVAFGDESARARYAPVAKEPFSGNVQHIGPNQLIFQQKGMVGSSGLEPPTSTMSKSQSVLDTAPDDTFDLPDHTD